MERLLTMDRQEYVSRMLPICRRIMEQAADAVNDAPTGNVIGGSEMRVRDLLAELRRTAFETAVQMRIDSHESNFSPSEGCVGEAQGEQGTLQPERAERERADRLVAPALVRRGRRKRQPGGPSAR